MTTTLPTVTATLGNKLLSNAATFFGNNLSTIISELLQNSRRAGATNIDIQIPTFPEPTSEGTITFTDNGSGIAVETFPTLLALGSSNWNDIIEGVESPAGMGLFSLATRNPVIETNGYKIVLNDAVFKGKENARILPGTIKSGTKITFDILKQDYEKHMAHHTATNDADYRQSILRSVIEQECIHAPLQVNINNTPVIHIDFGEGAIASEEMLGTRIYIHRHAPKTSIQSFSQRPSTNFYGHPISLPMTQNHRLMIIDYAHYTDTTPPKNMAKASEILDTATYSIRIDILDTTHLKPKLPDRNSFHETPAIEQIISRGRKMIYEIISKNLFQKIASYQTGPINSEQAKKEAESFGITLPPTFYDAKLYPGYATNKDSRAESVFFSLEGEIPSGIKILTKSFLGADLQTETSAPWIENKTPILYVQPSLAKKSAKIASTYDIRITDQNGTTTTFKDLIHNSFQNESHKDAVEDERANLQQYISEHDAEILTDISLIYRAEDGTQIGEPVSITYLPSFDIDAREFEASSLEIIYTEKATAKNVADSLSGIVMTDDLRDSLFDNDVSEPDEYIWDEIKKVASKSLSSTKANIEMALTEIKDKIADILANYEETFRNEFDIATLTIKKTKDGFKTTSSFKARKG